MLDPTTLDSPAIAAPAASPDDLLARVERPSRYLGNELHAVKKDLATVKCTVALAYPDLYEIGMSNTGLHILYHMLNESPDVAAERVYLPAPDYIALLRAEDRPLTTLENKIPLSEVDILGIQLPHELAFANIVKIIRLSGLPLYASARADDDPLVLGGGPGAFAAEPVAPFYDAMLLGDAEEALWQVVAAVREHKERRGKRVELLETLAGITGVYVPSFYAPRYAPDGTLEAIEAKNGAPKLVMKALVDDLETAYYPDKAIVPFAETVHNRLPVEVMRGCTVGCRFCQAGMIYRPLRERSPKRILDLAKCGLNATGFEDVSLLSLDTGDYTLIDPLTRELLETTADKRIALSLPSLRAGSLTDDVIRDITRVRRTSFTIAPEAGTQRLRDVINKNISDEEIFETVERVARNGWSGIKLYFMVGFPTETQDDLDGLVDLVTRCRDLARKHVKRFEATASIGTLVPKPHTPFMWDAQLSIAESTARLKYISRELKARKIGCKYADPVHSFMEGIFSRGDRRLAPVVAAAEARGAGMESWSDHLQIELWRTIMAEHGLDPAWFLRKREFEEVLPWDHLSARVTKKYLMNDRQKIDAALDSGSQPITFDCRDDLCAGCSTCFTGDTRNRLAKYHPDPFGDGRRLPIALTSRVAVGQSVARQLEQNARDQAAKAGDAALEAKKRRKRPKQIGERRWHVTPGAPGSIGPAETFKRAARCEEDEVALASAVVAESEARAAAPSLPPVELPEQESTLFHYRITYERRGELRWLAHREVMRTFYRAIHRVELPVRFTEGFHPKPKVAFGPPLPVGAESKEEELDLYLNAEADPERILVELSKVLPVSQGLIPRTCVKSNARSAHSERQGARWSVDLASVGASVDAAREVALRFAAAVAAMPAPPPAPVVEEGAPEAEPAPVVVQDDPARAAWTIVAERPGKPSRSVDLREVAGNVAVEEIEGAMRLTFDLRGECSAKPTEVTAALLGRSLDQVRGGRYLLLAAIRRAPRIVGPSGQPGSRPQDTDDGLAELDDLDPVSRVDALLGPPEFDPESRADPT